MPVCHPSWCRLCAFAIYDTFAAILADGTVVTWGKSKYGGTRKKGQLGNVKQIHATDSAFFAI